MENKNINIVLDKKEDKTTDNNSIKNVSLNEPHSDDISSHSSLTSTDNHLSKNQEINNLFTKINYNNEMIKLHQIDQLNNNNIENKEFIDKKINELKSDREDFLKYLNKIYDNNTKDLNLNNKLSTNDNYLINLQIKEINSNNEKINEFNNNKMNKDREYEIILYDIQEKNKKTNYLFWSLISLLLMVIIFTFNLFNIFNSFSTITFTFIIFFTFVIYLVIQLSNNSKRTNRYYDKYNFTKPPPIPEEKPMCEEEVEVDVKVPIVNLDKLKKVSMEHHLNTQEEEEEDKIKMNKLNSKCSSNGPLMTEEEFKKNNNPLYNQINI